MKRGTPEHSKMRRLKRALDLRLYEAVGLLECLWHLTDREAPRGDIGKLSDEAICDSLDWARDRKTLIDALVDCGWLDRCQDHRLVVHHWADHCTDALRKRIGRGKGGFANVRQCSPTADNGSQRQPPNPTQPSPSQPNLASPSPNPAAAGVTLVPTSGLLAEAVAAARAAPEAPGIDPRIEALMGIGMAFGNAGALVRRYSPTGDEVENYVERSMAPGINNRIAFTTACIREKREIEAVQAGADDEAALREGLADGRARRAAKAKGAKP